MTKDNELKQYRQAVRDKIKESQKERAKNIVFVAQEIDDILNGFGNAEETVISYYDLSLFKIGERVEVNEDVSFEKTYQDENRMTFITYMLDGGSFGIHKHDCYEIVRVLKGNLIERHPYLTSYKEGEEVIYSPNKVHKPYASMDSTYEVTFLKKLF